MTTPAAAPDTALTADDVATDVAAYVGGVPVTEFLTSCADTAITLVTQYVGTATVPGQVRRRAVVEVAAELYHRKSAPNGVKSFSDGLDGATAIRVARDPMVAGRPLLDPYLPVRFA